jgi:hypothetical protein
MAAVWVVAVLGPEGERNRPGAVIAAGAYGLATPVKVYGQYTTGEYASMLSG